MSHIVLAARPPIGPCRDYARRLKAKGASIEHTEYPDAHHVFDWPAAEEAVGSRKGADDAELPLGGARRWRRGEREDATTMDARKAVKEFHLQAMS